MKSTHSHSLEVQEDETQETNYHLWESQKPKTIAQTQLEQSCFTKDQDKLAQTEQIGRKETVNYDMMERITNSEIEGGRQIY